MHQRSSQLETVRRAEWILSIRAAARGLRALEAVPRSGVSFLRIYRIVKYYLYVIHQ